MIDIEKLRTLYKLGRDLSLNDVLVLVKAARKKRYQPEEVLIRDGSQKKELFFILKGLVRAYITNDKGENVTIAFRWEHQFVASIPNILFDEPAVATYEALEPTDVLFIRYETLDALVAKNAALEANRKRIFHEELKLAYTRIGFFVLLTPEERYLRFVEENQHILHRVQDRYIAHVLGVTPVSLSRIRKRIADRKV